MVLIPIPDHIRMPELHKPQHCRRRLVDFTYSDVLDDRPDHRVLLHHKSMLEEKKMELAKRAGVDLEEDRKIIAGE